MELLGHNGLIYMVNVESFYKLCVSHIIATWLQSNLESIYFFYHVWKQYVISLIVISQAAIHCTSNVQFSVPFITIDGPGSVSYIFHLHTSLLATLYMLNLSNGVWICNWKFIPWHQNNIFIGMMVDYGNTMKKIINIYGIHLFSWVNMASALDSSNIEKCNRKKINALKSTKSP